jgi:hypothetical protein
MLIASEDENADLFWALRGGGGNFGVCTSFEYRLHPVDTVYWGPMFYEVSETENILKFYREYIKDAPEQMGGFPAFQIAPPLPFIPEDRHGDMFAALVACWAGDPADGEKKSKPSMSARSRSRRSTRRSTASSRRASGNTGRATTSRN